MKKASILDKEKPDFDDPFTEDEFKQLMELLSASDLKTVIEGYKLLEEPRTMEGHAASRGSNLCDSAAGQSCHFTG